MRDLRNVELTDEQYEMADRIVLWLEAHAGALHNCSRIARGAKTGTTHQASEILRWLDANQMVIADGNGCWRKYGHRR